jgi:ABC-type enterochelin transport system substrate-binding protein
LVFKNVNYGSETVTPTDVPTGELDENDNPITESIKITELSAQQLMSVVRGKFEATTASGATDASVKISIDANYSLGDGEDKFVGTGSTITIYTTQGGVNIPLSTIKVVVKGDVTGDGVIDVLDLMVVELSANGYTSVTGVYNLAGDLSEDGTVGAADFQSVLNKAFGK